MVVVFLPNSTANRRPTAAAATLQSVKPGVVGVGVFNPTGSPRANLQGTGFAVLDGTYVVSCAHIFAKLLDSEKKETHAVFVARDRQMTLRRAKLVATDKARDLALLKIEGDPLPALTLGDASRAREGWRVDFPGYPIAPQRGVHPAHHPAARRARLPTLHPPPPARHPS